MLARLQLWWVLAAMAVFVALSLAPQAASAHEGHSHAPHAGMALQSSVPAAQQHDAEIVRKPVLQDLTEARPAAPCADDACNGRGCCSSGPCTGCHGFLVVPVPATLPPTLSSIVRPGDPPPHLDGETTRLRRPPKSFV